MEPESSQVVKQVALVTGANKGLGFETARQLSRCGVKVFLGSRDVAKGKAAAEELTADGGDVEPLTIDVTSEASVRAAAAHVEERVGRLDILINNAGIAPESANGFVVPLDLHLFKQTFETNVFGVVAVIQQFLPLLRKSNRGRIVNMSTTLGSLHDQSDEQSDFYGVLLPAYQASKATLNALTVSQAKALKDTNIKINSICPGWVQTDLGGPHALRSTEEGARIVVKMALLPDDGPTGGFFADAGAVAW